MGTLFNIAAGLGKTAIPATQMVGAWAGIQGEQERLANEKKRLGFEETRAGFEEKRLGMEGERLDIEKATGLRTAEQWGMDKQIKQIALKKAERMATPSIPIDAIYKATPGNVGPKTQGFIDSLLKMADPEQYAKGVFSPEVLTSITEKLKSPEHQGRMAGLGLQDLNAMEHTIELDTLKKHDPVKAEESIEKEKQALKKTLLFATPDQIDEQARRNAFGKVKQEVDELKAKQGELAKKKEFLLKVKNRAEQEKELALMYPALQEQRKMDMEAAKGEQPNEWSMYRDAAGGDSALAVQMRRKDQEKIRAAGREGAGAGVDAPVYKEKVDRVNSLAKASAMQNYYDLILKIGTEKNPGPGRVAIAKANPALIKRIDDLTYLSQTYPADFQKTISDMGWVISMLSPEDRKEYQRVMDSIRKDSLKRGIPAPGEGMSGAVNPPRTLDLDPTNEASMKKFFDSPLSTPANIAIMRPQLEAAVRSGDQPQSALDIFDRLAGKKTGVVPPKKEEGKKGGKPPIPPPKPKPITLQDKVQKAVIMAQIKAKEPSPYKPYIEGIKTVGRDIGAFYRGRADERKEEAILQRTTQLASQGMNEVEIKKILKKEFPESF